MHRELFESADFEIGNLRVFPERNLLSFGEANSSIEPRIMDVLCVLAHHRPDVVSRSKLLDKVWNVEYGGDESLTRAVSILRKSFLSLGIKDTVIETIPKRGYRIAQPVKLIGPTQLNKDLNNNLEIFTTAFFDLTRFNRKKVGVSAFILLSIFLGTTLRFPLITVGDSVTTPQTQVLRMIESGHITANEANSLLDKLTDLGSQHVVETLGNGTKLQKEALRLIADHPTFDQGMDLLEADATTAADWKLIAELGQLTSPKRAVEAAKKAIAMNPGDYDSFSILVKSLMNSGDYSDARRAHKSLKSIAQTSREHLKAAILQGDLAYETKSVEDANIAVKYLTEAINRVEPLEEIPLNGRSFSLMNEVLPLASEALATRGQLKFQTKEYDEIEPDLLRAVSLLESRLDKFQGRDLVKARRFLAIYHDIRARAKHTSGDLKYHHEAHEKALSQYRELADAGERTFAETLNIRLETLAREYADLNEPELAIERMSEAIERFEAYAAEFPDDKNLKLRRFRLNGTMSQLAGDFTTSQNHFLDGLKFLTKDLLIQGDPKKLQSVVSYVEHATMVLRRFDGAHNEDIYTVFTVANQSIEDFESLYGVSEETQLQKFRNRLFIAQTMIILDEPNEEIRSYAEQIIQDSRQEVNPNIELVRLERVQLHATYMIAWTEPADIKAVAKDGLKLARSLDQRGKLQTDHQSYINIFENMLQSNTTSID